MNFLSFFPKKIKHFTPKTHCDFCNSPFDKKTIKILNFSFLNLVDFHICSSCFEHASMNNFRISSTQMIQFYIKKESILYANDIRLQNFIGSKIFKNGLWNTINSLDYFSNSDFKLPFITSQNTVHSDNFSNNPEFSQQNDFWSINLKAELAHSLFLGYCHKNVFYQSNITGESTNLLTSKAKDTSSCTKTNSIPNHLNDKQKSESK